MTTSILKKAYDAIAVVALLNLALLAGGVAYLATGGGLDGEKLRQIAAVMRGEATTSADEAEAEGGDDAKAQMPEAGENPAGPVNSRTELEIIHREAERIEAELQQRLALNNSILLRVTTEREKFQREREAALKQDEVKDENRKTVGFQKQLAILQGLAPKLASRHLLSMKDADEAAQILLQMSTNRAKKIVAAAKRGNDLTKMQQILLRMRKLSPDSIAAISSDNG